MVPVICQNSGIDSQMMTAERKPAGPVTVEPAPPAEWEQQVPCSRRKRVRCVFAGCVFLLLGQYGLMFLVGEPYPALLLPPFEGSGYEGHEVSIPKVTVNFLSSGQVVHSCPHYTLLDRLPRSYHRDIAGNVFSPRVQREDSLWHNKEPRPKSPVFFQLFPGFHRANRDHLAGKNLAALQTWLKQRAEKLVPEVTVDTVVIRWDAETYDMRLQPPAVSGENLAGELTIPLEITPDARARVAFR